MREYVVEIYSRSGTARERFDRLFSARGVFQPRLDRVFSKRGSAPSGRFFEIHREALLSSSMLDDLFLRDNVDVSQSAGAEHIIRRLYGIEEVLRLNGSKEELEAANWAAADAYDLPELVERSAPPLSKARAEASRRLRISRRRRAVLKKWARRSDNATAFGDWDYLVDKRATQWLEGLPSR